MNKKIVVLIVVILLTVGGCVAYLLNRQDEEPAVQPLSTPQTIELTTETPEVPSETIDESPEYDLLNPSSITFIANKSRPLPDSYTPTDLVTPGVKLRLSAGAEQMQFRGVAHDDLKAMFTAASEDGVTLVFGSGYRSYALQKQFYDSYVARDGVAAADRYSARPGTSEHQTGLSFDATSASQKCHLEICFENTPEGQWLAAHAYEYGFVLRYPNGKESITGYQYEPWHFRYLGIELAATIQSSGLAVEEFFKL